MINETLPALGLRYHMYEFSIPEDIDDGIVSISVRMLFRPFRPLLIETETPELLYNLPIFEMAAITGQIEVINQ